MDQAATVTAILARSRDAEEALRQAIPLVIADLRRIAGALAAARPRAHALDPTELVSELYAELAGNAVMPHCDRNSFVRLCAVVMRRIIIRDLRLELTAKRGGKEVGVELEYAENLAEREDLDLPMLLTLDCALERLAETEPRLSALVEMRFFAGFTIEETAAALERSPASVKRDWLRALELLRLDMEDTLPPNPTRRRRLTLDFLARPIFTLGRVEAAPLQPGQRVGEYAIEELLGCGGSAEVYLVRRSTDPKQQLALKLLKRELAGVTELHRQFQREARFEQLRHPGVVGAFDSGVSECGRPYLVMDYVNGAAIDAYCNERRLSLGRKLRLFEELCDIVEYLHSRSIVHCDLKPRNIIVTTLGLPKILDFGISRPAWTRPGSDGQLRSLTWRYASPEQIRAESPTPAVDVYSLGVILFEMITGQLPYRGSDPQLRQEPCQGERPGLVRILSQEEMVSVIGDEHWSAGWRDRVSGRRQCLRLAHALAPVLARVLSWHSLRRGSIRLLKQDLAAARAVCVEFERSDRAEGAVDEVAHESGKIDLANPRTLRLCHRARDGEPVRRGLPLPLGR